jgi:hypothetical protein
VNNLKVVTLDGLANSVDLIIFPRLSTCSKRAFLRERRGGRRIEEYVPRGRLLNRLQGELGMSEAAIIERCAAEREFLLGLRWI